MKVDADDGAGPGQRRGLDHVETHAATADHHHGRSGLHFGPIEYRGGSSEDAATGHGGNLHGDVVGNRYGPPLVADELLRKGADGRELVKAAAVRVNHTGGAIGGVGAGERQFQIRRTQVGPSLQAVPAHSAVDQGRQHHVVAHLTGGDLTADLLHHARALMAEDHGKRKRQVPGLHRDIGVAQPAGPDPDPHIVGADRARGEFDHFDWHSGLINNGSLHLSPPDCRSPGRRSGAATLGLPSVQTRLSMRSLIRQPSGVRTSWSS